MGTADRAHPRGMREQARQRRRRARQKPAKTFLTLKININKVLHMVDASDLGPCEHCGAGLALGHMGQELRCACGSLMGRLVSGGLELKCRRCKRALIVPVATQSQCEPGRD